MAYYWGMDGGGTKTACLLIDEAGNRLAEVTGPSTSHWVHGVDGVVEIVRDLARQCTRQAGTTIEALAGACLGLPGRDEHPEEDAAIEAQLRETFLRMVPVNDVQVGWAGSLACAPGINVVSGTGSISFGCDEAGATTRSGGWSEQYGDEGSSYWVAVKGMQLFSKMADGRRPKGPLYHMVMERYSLESDMDFITEVDHKLFPQRAAVASFQKLVSDAGDAGDTAVHEIYRQAAAELCELAKAIKDGLNFKENPVKVSHSGSTYKAGAMLLEPMAEYLARDGMQLCTPLLEPVAGAALFAVKTFTPERFDAVRAALLA